MNVNPDNPVINVRSFGEDPADVSRYVAATVRGLQSGQVLATLKHFPGHGDTASDSHRALATVPGDRARIESVELPPFRAGIAAGAESVMIAHVSVPALDATPVTPLANAPKPVDAIGDVTVVPGGAIPATLSPAIVTGVLRKELGFHGLVVTDAMRMGGITYYFEPGEAAVRAILAGADQILLSSDTDAAIQAVLAAVKSGRITEKRLDESVRRILDVKKRLGLYGKGVPFVGRIATIVGTRPHEELEAEIARRSMTLVREQAGALPFRREAKLLSLVVADEPTLHGPAARLEKELKARVPGVKSVRLDTRSTPEEAKAAVDAAKDADAVLLSLFVRARSGQGKFVIPGGGAERDSRAPRLRQARRLRRVREPVPPARLPRPPDVRVRVGRAGRRPDGGRPGAVRRGRDRGASPDHDPGAREEGGRHREGGCRPVKPAQMGRTIGARGFGMRRRALVSGLLAALALAPPAARGEQLPIKAYSTADGLPSDRIHCILADSRGFLWLGTEDGISLFDGYSFTNTSVAEGLPGASRAGARRVARRVVLDRNRQRPRTLGRRAGGQPVACRLHRRLASKRRARRRRTGPPRGPRRRPLGRDRGRVVPARPGRKGMEGNARSSGEGFACRGGVDQCAP